jgi:phosphoserine aminotransferase
LAVLVCSPRALAKAASFADTRYYNSLLTIAKHGEQNQNSYTPNVLAIYALGHHLALCPPVAESSQALQVRSNKYYEFVANHPLLTPLVERTASQSPTVLAVKASPEALARLKAAALAQNMQLGNGYGVWKETTFRIANFPAYTEDDQNRLLAVLAEVK